MCCTSSVCEKHGLLGHPTACHSLPMPSSLSAADVQLGLRTISRLPHQAILSTEHIPRLYQFACLQTEKMMIPCKVIIKTTVNIRSVLVHVAGVQYLWLSLPFIAVLLFTALLSLSLNLHFLRSQEWKIAYLLSSLPITPTYNEKPSSFLHITVIGRHHSKR